jgi:hypothetical protein
VATFDYPVGGCRGSIVNLDVEVAKVQGLRFELRAPSGTTVASEDLSLRIGHVLGKSIRLPESGFYQVRLTANLASESRQTCTKYQGKTCSQQQSYYVYPFDFHVGFRGNAEAPALRVGERGDGTVTAQEPLSRRVTVEGGERLQARVVATVGRVVCTAHKPDGTSLPVIATAGGGCQVVFPASERDVDYALSVASAANEPAGVTLLVEAAGGSKKTLTAGAQAEDNFELLAPPGSRGLLEAQAEWAIKVPARGNYTLTVVPSGLARLEVDVMLYNRSTEEIVVDHVRVAGRRALATNFPAPGEYVLRVTPLTYDAQSAQGHAKYTLLLQVGAGPP